MNEIPFVDIYGSTDISKRTEFIHVESMADRRDFIKGKVSAHSHKNLFQLIYAEKGCCNIRIDNHQQVISGPCIVYIPGGTVHSLSFEHDSEGWVITGAEKLFSSNQETRISSYIAPLIRAPLTKSLTPESTEQKRIRWLIQELHSEYKSLSNAQDPTMEAMTKLLLINVRRDILKDTQSPGLGNHKQQFFYRFRKLLESSFREHTTTSEYAEKLGLTVTQLNKICQKYSGKTAHNLAQERLLLEAERLLIYTEININQIGFDLGFKDPGYFNRFFKRKAGIPPAKYRENKQASL